MSFFFFSLLLLLTTSSNQGPRGYPGPPGPPGICTCDTTKPQSTLHKSNSQKHNKQHNKNIHTNTDKSLKTNTDSDYYNSKNILSNIHDTHFNKNNNILNKNIKQHENGHKLDISKTKYNESNGFELDDKYTREYNQTYNKNYRESIGNEGHRGKYKGNEYNINNKLNKINNNYLNNKYGNNINIDEYNVNNGDINGKYYNKYDEDKYVNYNDNDYDKYNREIEVGNVGKGNGFGFKVGRYGEESSKDDRYVKDGYGIDEKYGESKNNNIGVQYDRKINGNNYVENSKGEFTEISNTGSNKQADYSGDYNNRDKYTIINNNENLKENFHEYGDTLPVFDENGNLQYGTVGDVETRDTYSENEQYTNTDYDGYYKYSDINKNGKENNINKKLNNNKYIYNDKYNNIDKQASIDGEYYIDKGQGRYYDKQKNKGYYHRRRLLINDDGIDKDLIIKRLKYNLFLLNIGFVVLFGVVCVLCYLVWGKSGDKSDGYLNV